VQPGTAQNTLGGNPITSDFHYKKKMHWTYSEISIAGTTMHISSRIIWTRSQFRKAMRHWFEEVFQARVKEPKNELSLNKAETQRQSTSLKHHQNRQLNLQLADKTNAAIFAWKNKERPCNDRHGRARPWRKLLTRRDRILLL
jgi:hypothetical protein